MIFAHGVRFSIGRAKSFPDGSACSGHGVEDARSSGAGCGRLGRAGRLSWGAAAMMVVVMCLAGLLRRRGLRRGRRLSYRAVLGRGCRLGRLRLRLVLQLLGNARGW
jgi:hypothetical protein